MAAYYNKILLISIFINILLTVPVSSFWTPWRFACPEDKFFRCDDWNSLGHHTIYGKQCIEKNQLCDKVSSKNDFLVGLFYIHITDW